ncbi:hypothetical protein BGZ52_008788, partial [Haplosporangium bisporale]
MSSMNHHRHAHSLSHSHSHSHSLLDDRDDDALVPTSFPTAPPPLATSPPKSYWDTAFYSSTPTPKPPPRLAPMPRSPPALSIQTTPSTTSSSNNNNTPIVAPSDRLGTKSRYALAYQSHNRSLSHSQAHSHHGNNIFSHPPDSRNNNPHPGSGSPSVGSGTMTNSSERSSIGIGYNPDQIIDFTTRPQSLSHASPRSVSSSSNPHNTHPLLTPSSSQTLFSNLPSPLTRTSLSSTASLLRDPSSNAGQGATSFATAITRGDDISEASLFQDQTLPPSSSGSTASTTTATSLSTHDVPNSSSSSSSRKIYPGLKNTVGPYKLLHNIGQGSFSQVKMAVDTRTGDHVAIKVMSRAMVQSSDRLGISVRRESDLLK